MSDNQQSIWSTSFRALLHTFFRVLAVGLALIALVVFIGLISGESSSIEPETSIKVLPGPNGERKPLGYDTPLILQINISGVIGSPALEAKDIDTILLESREGKLKDNRVKAVLLRINSPGGTVVDADRIYHAILRYKNAYKTPVLAYVDGLCASGGYYIAASADKIAASNVSLIGSVGVIIPTFMNFNQLLDKVGVQSMTLYEGKYKDEMNPFREWKPGEADPLKSVVSYYYQSFVELVTRHRPGLDKDKLVEDYGAKVFPAEEAKSLGYIDEANSSDVHALKELAEMAGLEEDKYQVIELEERGWFKDLFREESPLFTGKITHQIELGPVNSSLANQFLYLYIPGQ